MSRWAVAFLAGLGVFAATGPHARAAESTACPDEWLSLPPCGGAEAECASLIEDLDLLLVEVPEAAGDPKGDCTLPEPETDALCEDPEAALTPWLAGILGLCDAPYGLGLRGPASRMLRVARIGGAPARRLPLAPQRSRSFGEDGGMHGAPPPPSPPPTQPDPGLLVSGPELDPPAGCRMAALSVDADERDGFSRRIERPPRGGARL